MPRDAQHSDAVWDLVERAREGDRAAFGELFRLHHPAVFRVARARLPHAAAQDAAAETFTRAWVALPRYRRTGAPFIAWLYGITRNVVADMARRGARTESQAQPDLPASDPWSSRDDHIDLLAALADLPEDQRRVIELKYLVGLTNVEVAAALGKKPGAVNAQQWRALRALERMLGER